MSRARTRRRHFLRPLAAGAGVLMALALAACEPDSGFNTVRDYDLVATFYATDARFDPPATYAMPDTVMHFHEPGDTSGMDLSREFDDLILELVRSNLDALGYTEETEPASNPPDVFVVVWATTTDWLSNSSQDWWNLWRWYPHWPEAWGPGVEISYPWPVEYFYRAGSLFIEMVDEGEIDEGGDPYVQVLWNASINGIMADTSTSAQDRLTAGIEQAFDQSPYLAGEK